MAATDAGVAPLAPSEPVPSVIVSHLDVVYKVYGTGGPSRRPPRNRLGRWLNRGRRHMGVREVHAVKDVSFVAYEGESIGIVGRNGSGKSTLLRALAGLMPAAGGTVYHRGHAALLGVNAVLARNLTGARNVFIGAQALGLTRQQVRAKYREIVQFAGIGEFVNLPMSSYSSGMAARLRFAISTASVPDILVVDEALGTGDAEFRDKATARIEQFRQAAGTVFLVSHNNATIRAQCERVLWMDQGRLVMDGPAEEVVDAYVADIKRRAAAQKGRGKGRTKGQAKDSAPTGHQEGRRPAVGEASATEGTG